MTICDIDDGLLQPECLTGQAGVKTVFFFRHSSLNLTYNAKGEITGIGTGIVLRFDQDNYHGMASEEVMQGREGENSYIQQTVEMTMYYISPEFRETIDLIRLGRWAIFCEDYQGKIKLYGEINAMKQNGGQIETGKAPDDNLYSSLVFQGVQDHYARFLEDYTTYPFDNMAGVIVSPRYDNRPGLLVLNGSGDNILIDVNDNKLDHN